LLKIFTRFLIDLTAKNNMSTTAFLHLQGFAPVDVIRRLSHPPSSQTESSRSSGAGIVIERVRLLSDPLKTVLLKGSPVPNADLNLKIQKEYAILEHVAKNGVVWLDPDVHNSKGLNGSPTSKELESAEQRRENTSLQLRHSRAIQPIEILDNKGSSVMVCEDFKGVSLSQFMIDFGLASDTSLYKRVELTINIALQIAAALEEIHSADVVHRNLNLENVQLKVNPEGSIEVQVSNFENAQIVKGVRIPNSTLTGSLAYIPPGILCNLCR
jgi:serine/threonine protein kinase